MRLNSSASGAKTRRTVVINPLGNTLESRLVWLDPEPELEPLGEDVHDSQNVR